MSSTAALVFCLIFIDFFLPKQFSKMIQTQVVIVTIKLTINKYGPIPVVQLSSY